MNSSVHSMLSPMRSWALWPERWRPMGGGGGDAGRGDAVAQTKPARRSTVCARMPEVVLVARLLVTVRRGACVARHADQRLSGRRGMRKTGQLGRAHHICTLQALVTGTCSVQNGFLRGAGFDGYASGGVPVTGALPELGQSRSAGLSPPKWHFTGTWAAHHDPRTIS